MCTPATVRIDNNFASGKSSIALGSSDDEQARGLNLLAISIVLEEIEHSLHDIWSDRQGTPLG